MADEAERPAFEPAEIPRPGVVSAVVVGFFLFAVALMGILLAIYSQVKPRPQLPEVFPKPQLEPYPQADFSKYQQAQEQRLRQSGWIDKPLGIAAIPVDKAMQIIGKRGVSAFDPLPEAQQGQPPKEPAK